MIAFSAISARCPFFYSLIKLVIRKVQDLFRDIFHLIACQQFDEVRRLRFELTDSTPMKTDAAKH